MGEVGTPSLCSQPHGNCWSMVRRRELKGQDSAPDSLWASHIACLSSPFPLLCSNSKLAASWGCEMFGRGRRKAAGGTESFILQCPCCTYRVMFIKQYQPILAGNSSSQNLFSTKPRPVLIAIICCKQMLPGISFPGSSILT